MDKPTVIAVIRFRTTDNIRMGSVSAVTIWLTAIVDLKLPCFQVGNHFPAGRVLNTVKPCLRSAEVIFFSL